MTALGVQPRVVMEQLGHTKISTSMEVYTDVPSDSLKDVAERMQAAWTAGS